MPDAIIRNDPQTESPSGDRRDGYVFISYKREEAEHAKRIRGALRKSRFEVWWDEDIQCGQVWNEVLDDAVKQAGCIVVLWSRRSMQSPWVKHEASGAIVREVYAPVRIDLCPIQAPYNRLQATDIDDWDGNSHHPGVLDLLQRVNDLLPVRKPLPARVAKWCWSNYTTIASMVFAILAIGILSWQTVAARRQIDRLDQLVEITLAGPVDISQLSLDCQISFDLNSEDFSDYREKLLSKLEEARKRLEESGRPALYGSDFRISRRQNTYVLTIVPGSPLCPNPANPSESDVPDILDNFWIAFQIVLLRTDDQYDSDSRGPLSRVPLILTLDSRFLTDSKQSHGELTYNSTTGRVTVGVTRAQLQGDSYHPGFTNRMDFVGATVTSEFRLPARTKPELFGLRLNFAEGGQVMDVRGSSITATESGKFALRAQLGHHHFADKDLPLPKEPQ